MAGINLGPIAAFIERTILLDVVRFTLPGAGEPVFDDETGDYTYPEGEVFWEGPGAVQPGNTQGGLAAVPVANQPWRDETRSGYVALTPLSAPVPERDMIATVVQVHAGGDAALIGRQWRVQDPGKAGTLGAVRITVLDQVQQTQGAG